MKNILTFFLIIAMCLSLFAQENDSSNNDVNETDWGNIEGRIRLYHIFNPAYVKSGRTNDYKINGSTVGGFVRYNSPEFKGFGASTAVYFARGTGLNDKDNVNVIMAAGRFFTADFSPKAVLGELNLHYTYKSHYVLGGRYDFDSPLTNSIYTYMPNMFQALQYENSSLKDTKITIAQIEKMAYGTRSPVEFGLIGELTNTAGATQNGLNTRGDFIDIEKQTLNDPNANTNGLTVLAIENSSLRDTKIQAWNFYAYDIMNMFYTDMTYSKKDVPLPYSFSAQYLRTDSVGKDLAAGLMDSSSAYLMGLKATLKYEKAFFHLSYNHSGSSKILNPWNGDPAYTSTFFSRNAYRAEVDAYKLGFNYDLLKDLKLITYYADYGISKTKGTFAPSKPVELPLKLGEYDAIETGALLKYKPLKGLTVLGGVIYRTSEYSYASKQVKLLDVDLVITYDF